MERVLRDALPNGTFGEVAAGDIRRMRAVRGKGNRTTEARLRAILTRAGIRGWRMQTKEVPGKPDFYFPDARVAIFCDGCFWHGCPHCGHVPSKNNRFWKAKISRNKQRDEEKQLRLEEAGVLVLRLWEHELQGDLGLWVRRLRQTISARILANARSPLPPDSRSRSPAQ